MHEMPTFQEKEDILINGTFNLLMNQQVFHSSFFHINELNSNFVNDKFHLARLFLARRKNNIEITTDFFFQIKISKKCRKVYL